MSPHAHFDRRLDDLRVRSACGPLRPFASGFAHACLHRRGIRPPGCPAPLMSPGSGLRPKPPPLLRCAGHPGGPIRQQRLFAIVERHPCGLPRAWGGRCSEVKEETAAARPSSGDMSVSGRPTNAARATVRTRAQQQIASNVRNGPGADDRQTSSVCWDSFILDSLQVCLFVGGVSRNRRAGCSPDPRRVTAASRSRPCS